MTESRYHRQIQVEGIGPEGQRRIGGARVAVVGVGALGCAVADQLVRAGVRSIRLIDSDTPELSNLTRQVLIDEDDVERKRPKALAAAQKLKRANSEVLVEPRVARFDPETARDLIDGIDLVFDGTDNFETRYLINRVCLERRLPWVFGGVLGMSGMSFPVVPGGPCLCCALGPGPADGRVETTLERGVLLATVSAVASWEVVRGLKIMMGKPVRPNLIVVDLDRESVRCVKIERDPGCPICG